MPFKGDLLPPSAPRPEPWLGLVGSFPPACLLPHPHLQFILLLLRDLLSKSWMGTWQSFASKAFWTLSTYRLGFLFLKLAPAYKAPRTSWSAPRHSGLLFHCSLSPTTPVHASATWTSHRRLVSGLCACDHVVVSAWPVFLPFSTYLVLPFPSNSP